jgi:hypothetical protein
LRAVQTQVTVDICLVFPAISAVEAGFEVQAVLDASGSSFDIGEETSRPRMERAGVWLTSTNTMVAELLHNWATPQGMKLVPSIAANPPMLPVERSNNPGGGRPETFLTQGETR